MQLEGTTASECLPGTRGLPLIHPAQCLNALYSIKLHFLQCSNFCQLTRCLRRPWLGRSTWRVCHAGLRRQLQHHLSLKLPEIQNFSSNWFTLNPNWSYNSNFNMKLEFLFSVLQLWPSSPLLCWKGPRQQPSKWGRQNRPPLFMASLSAHHWGEGLKRRTRLWKAACLLAILPQRTRKKKKKQKLSRTKVFHSPFVPSGIISGKLPLFFLPNLLPRGDMFLEFKLHLQCSSKMHV